LDYASFPRIKGKRPGNRLISEIAPLAVMDDLLGPADGPEEEINGMSVRDRYLVGKLAPLETMRP
jgi:hypothetical protein